MSLGSQSSWDVLEKRESQINTCYSIILSMMKSRVQKETIASEKRDRMSILIYERLESSWPLACKFRFERFTREVYGDGGEKGERKYDTRNVTEQFLEKSATVYKNVEEEGRLGCKVLYVTLFYLRRECKENFTECCVGQFFRRILWHYRKERILSEILLLREFCLWNL